ncbi:putative F-box protein At5g60060 [Eucalyptus grandis]|uniref:putative F-box protein At5g60060 n=1 Tax=Eucalyptus grandis TaxID=71139 RepID=UPI00192EE796|nr:putative F-box protein At5g60060 [Eucalyptus grandis]
MALGSRGGSGLVLRRGWLGTAGTQTRRQSSGMAEWLAASSWATAAVVARSGVYDGKVCIIDGSGSVSHIDSSFRLQSFSLPIHDRRRRGSGYWKHLVVSSGDLYAVDRFVRQGVYASDPEYMKTYGFRVYRLNHRCGRWEEVRSLGNSAFFLCKLCSFAVPARELGGRDGNCIYYAEKTGSFFSREDLKVFSLADRSIKCLGFSDFIWRLPT